MSALALARRWIHLTASVALVGGAVMLRLAGRSNRATACAWHATRAAGQYGPPRRRRQLGRRAGGPADALAGQTITWDGPEREWRDVDGVVRAVLSPPGIMGFRTAVPKIPEPLSAGDAVRFTVRGSSPLVVLAAIEKTP